MEQTPDIITVGGFKLKIKTDFFSWVKIFKYPEKINDIFLEKLPKNLNEKELLNSLKEWLWGDNINTNYNQKKITTSKAFDFDIDGNIIYIEMWQYFPTLMQKGISFHEGMEIIKLLLANENTVLHHRAYARCGDFSKLSKEQKKYWQKERAKYAIKMSEEDFDNVLAQAFF